MKQKSNMLEGSLWDKILLFALPLAASSTLQQLFNAADVAVVGRFAGSEALAAVGANAPVINLLVNMFVGLSVGANVVISTLIGQNSKNRVEKAVHTAVVLAVLSGIFLAGVGTVFARPILSAIATPDSILDLAVRYLTIYFCGMPFIMLYNFTSAILRSKGDTKRPLYALLCAGVINVILNLVFVIGCHMSVEGVAIATVVSNVISSGMLTFFLVREEGAVHLDVHKLGIDPGVLRWIASIGLPAGLQSSMFSFANVMVQASLNSLGATAIAGSSAGLNFEYFTYFVINGFAQAAVTFIGQNYGAGQLKRCRRVMYWCLFLGETATMAMVGIFMAGSPFFVGLFTTDAAVAEMAIQRMVMILPYEAFNAAIEFFSGGLRGMGRSGVPALICVGGICGLRLIWIHTAFPADPTFGTLCYVYPLSWIVTSSVLCIAYFLVRNRVEKTFGLLSGTHSA